MKWPALQTQVFQKRNDCTLGIPMSSHSHDQPPSPGSWWRAQLRLIHYALLFYTRLPVPKLAEFDAAMQDHASRYFPLVGWLVGGLCAMGFVAFSQIFTHSVAVLLSMVLGVLLTGGFHEDGLADSCDGLGGGWSSEKILEIMKDSRVGVYGLLGLISVFALKFACLVELNQNFVPIALVAGHVISRWVTTPIMWKMHYVRSDATTKAKPMSSGFSQQDFFYASLISLPIVFVLPFAYWLSVLFIAPPVGYFIVKLKRWLGGYTGDTLGAVQQLSEVSFYLGLLAVL